MRWLWIIASVLCFAVAFRTHSMGLAALCLLLALGFLLAGTLALASSRIESRAQNASALLGPDELRRIREQAERRKRESGADGVGAAAGGGGSGSARRDADSDAGDGGGGGGDGGGD